MGFLLWWSECLSWLHRLRWVQMADSPNRFVLRPSTTNTCCCTAFALWEKFSPDLSKSLEGLLWGPIESFLWSCGLWFSYNLVCFLRYGGHFCLRLQFEMHFTFTQHQCGKPCRTLCSCDHFHEGCIEQAFTRDFRDLLGEAVKALTAFIFTPMADHLFCSWGAKPCCSECTSQWAYFLILLSCPIPFSYIVLGKSIIYCSAVSPSSWLLLLNVILLTSWPCKYSLTNHTRVTTAAYFYKAKQL